MILQAAIKITCHDHSTAAWVGRSYTFEVYGIASFSGDFHMWWHVYHYITPPF